MNWSRGFFRLWVAIACLWIGATTAFFYLEWLEQRWYEAPIVSVPVAEEKTRPTVKAGSEDRWSEAAPVAEATGNRRETDTDRRAEVARQRRLFMERYICAGLLPPLGLLGAGLVIRWIFRGFVRHEEKPL